MMTELPEDHAVREEALDLTRSFIVQAPAGSGKTEILTQRFLKLLSHVNQPEEILAITFTKKSAAEMRDRIIKALQLSQHDLPTHRKKTYLLAQAVLKQDQLHHWHLLDNPNRLRIQTIDSFNATLAKHLPILSHLTAYTEITDQPEMLYQEAVRECLAQLEENHEWSDAIQQLLIYLNNDLQKVENLLISLLTKRDQWLNYVMLAGDSTRLRRTLETHLQSIIQETLRALTTHFPKHLQEELLTLAAYAADQLSLEKNNIINIHCKNIASFPKDSIADRLIWKAFLKLCFTEKLTWRERIDKNIGFPSEKNTDYKARLKSLLDSLRENTALTTAFQQLAMCPEPCYTEQQWLMLSSLFQVLKILSAQLKITFQKHGKIDHIENAEAALAALGPEDAPTDLALSLDYQIKHILMDEFQDTSNSQFKLLEKLTLGWEKNDGRTLFLVGDPMQSIYRFREAEVGLFLRARSVGVGAIALSPLQLTVNFRSTSHLIEWINQGFNTIFPKEEDIATGAISFSKSQAAIETSPYQAVAVHSFFNDSEVNQANAIVNLIREQQATSPDEKTAILVRSRSQLKYILTALKAENILYQALHIDPLFERPVIEDLLSLTKALLHPAHRVAWLSLLRAPFIGFSLQDLWSIANHVPHQTLFEQLSSLYTESHSLTEDGKKRLQRVFPVLKQQLFEKQRMPLAEWIEKTWHLLGGPAAVNQPTDLLDAETFFSLLASLDQGGDLMRFDELDNKVKRLFAAPNSASDDRLQIMTIHNSKGLEFDTVILPHLESAIMHEERQLLLWMERFSAGHDPQLLLSAAEAVGENENAIYEYIRHQQSIKLENETDRLLYVAVTRAKKHLHLLFSIEAHPNKPLTPPRNSLLEKLWPTIQSQITFQTNQAFTQPTVQPAPSWRLIANWENNYQKPLQPESQAQSIQIFEAPLYQARVNGTVMHRILENISRYGIAWWEKLADPLHYIQHLLNYFGTSLHALKEATDIIEKAVRHTIADPRGQWILFPHTEAQNEFEITTLINDKPTQFIIDRTFVDESNTRWIIDYKSSFDTQNNLETFFSREYQKYKAQMHEYAEALKAWDARPIRLGLYFPLIPAWYEWTSGE